MPELSPEQAAVADRIRAFIKARSVPKQWFSVQGLAGTGKSHLLAQIAREFPDALPCAFTGKAASVLSRRLGRACSTIHSAIYKFLGETEEGDPRFASRIRDDSWNHRIVLLDESSTIDTYLARDLLATGCRVIAAGDPGQLPPVQGHRFFDAADAVLRTVHRQAWDSAIIRQAHSVRQNGRYAADGPDFRVTSHVEHVDIVAADAILCWKNETRRGLNALKRAHLGLSGFPRRGEPVMALKNEHEIGLLNGAVYTLLDDIDPGRPVINITGEKGNTVTLRDCWFEDVFGVLDKSKTGFAYAYAATVHKMQGSEVERIILVDEYSREDNRREFLYTAITRASRGVLVMSPGNAGT